MHTPTHTHKHASSNSLLLYTLLMMRVLGGHWFNYICMWYYLGISLWFFWGLCQNLAEITGPLRKERSSWEISASKAWLSTGSKNKERDIQQKYEWWGTHSRSGTKEKTHIYCKTYHTNPINMPRCQIVMILCGRWNISGTLHPCSCLSDAKRYVVWLDETSEAVTKHRYLPGWSFLWYHQA